MRVSTTVKGAYKRLMTGAKQRPKFSQVIITIAFPSAQTQQCEQVPCERKIPEAPVVLGLYHRLNTNVQ